MNKHFIFEPNGSQEFPDFIIFCGKDIFLVEIKFSKKSKKSQKPRPMWNSNLPKSSSIYIFASANNNLTFFKGVDFLGDETRGILNNFFDELESNILLKKLKNKLEENNLTTKENENFLGLKPYIRKAFDYSTAFKTISNYEDDDIFNAQRCDFWESEVINFIRGKSEE